MKLRALAPVGEDLNDLCAALAGNERFRSFLMNPDRARDQKAALIDKVLSGRSHPLTMSVLQLLLNKRRETELESIRYQYAELRREHESIVHATITSAKPLSEEQQNAIIGKLADATKKRIEPEYRVEPQLLGGVKVAFGSYVMDGTVRGSLGKLRDRLIHDVLKQN